MERRILKFVLRPGTTVIETEDEPRFLTVGWQGEDLCVWAEATVGEGTTTWLGAIPTGAYLPDDGEYIGSAQTETFGQRLVFHVYRRALTAVRTGTGGVLEDGTTNHRPLDFSSRPEPTQVLR